ncbi:DMT family transporter [bacterium]|nr:DMT family transporter [bacterium]MBU1652430.1 DMT family transporter [bacterium]
MSDTSKGYAYVVVSALLTGAVFTFGKVVTAALTPEFVVAWIFTVAAAILGVWTITSGRWREFRQCSRRDWLYILLFSAFSVAAIHTTWLGIKHLDPTVAAFISRLQTVVAIILGVLLLKERFRWPEAVGGVAVLAGVIVIRVSFDVSVTFWFWVMVLSGVLFGITEIFAKKAVRSLSPIPLNFFRNAIIALVFLVYVSTTQGGLMEFKGLFWIVMIIGITGPLLSRLCFLYALSYIDVSKAVLVNQLQPFFVAVTAFAAIGMIPTLREWTGGILILVGCAVMIGGRRKS